MKKDTTRSPFFKHCGDCAHMTNVKDEDRDKPNVMGGCFITGRITYTDVVGCRHIDPINKK